jgi:hypothetical protein
VRVARALPSGQTNPTSPGSQQPGTGILACAGLTLSVCEVLRRELGRRLLRVGGRPAGGERRGARSHRAARLCKLSLLSLWEACGL